MYAPYAKRDLYNVLPLLKVFLKPIYTLYTLYKTLASISVVFQDQRPLESSQHTFMFCNMPDKIRRFEETVKTEFVNVKRE